MTLSARPSTRLSARCALACAAAVAAVGLLPGVAAAEAPSNDDFDAATAITALPFTAAQSTAGATMAGDDPTHCQNDYSGNSVWYRFTAIEDTLVQATFGTKDFTAAFVAFTGARGELAPVPGGCGGGDRGGSHLSFPVTGGTTYHLMVTSYHGTVDGSLHFGLREVSPAANDDFASATPITALPVQVTDGDLSRAGAEQGEPAPGCASESSRSVWYRYTPTSAGSVALRASGYRTPALTVYEGTGLGSLTELACVRSNWESAVFSALAGRTYHIRVSAEPDDASWFDLGVDVAPPLLPVLSVDRERLSVFDEAQFTVYQGDEMNQPRAGGHIDFGDGTTVALPVDGSAVQHRYAEDGEYRVEYSVASADGRTGTGAETVRVQTHDVTVAGLVAPATARARTTKPVTVSVANTRYDETVVVRLYKVVDGDAVQLGQAQQWVPARASGTTQFPFAYTFTADDAAAGSVTFRAVASLPTDWELDDNAEDNTVERQTEVRPRVAGMS